MTPFLASILRLRAAALVLLAAIVLQAGLPLAAPLERPHGSAWSAGTIDVAIAATRKSADVATVAALDRTGTPVPAAPVNALRIAIATDAFPAHYWPEVRGPPPRAHPARLPDSTAPPLA